MPLNASWSHLPRQRLMFRQLRQLRNDKKIIVSRPAATRVVVKTSGKERCVCDVVIFVFTGTTAGQFAQQLGSISLTRGGVGRGTSLLHTFASIPGHVHDHRDVATRPRGPFVEA